MKRRRFIKASVSAAGVLSGCGERIHTNNANTTNNSVMDAKGLLGGYTLAELEKQYEHDLFFDFLPFMDEYVIDHTHGGFMCNTGRNGTNINHRKNAGYEGCGIWVYSFLYNNFDTNPEYLKTALDSAHFILRSKPEGDALWPEILSREGAPISSPGSRIINDMNIATGFQELARATGENRWFDSAKEIMLKCMEIYDSPHYYPEYPSKNYYLGEGAPSITGPKCVGEWMVLFWCAARMIDYREDVEIRNVRDKAAEAVSYYHYNEELQLINELLNHDYTLPDNEISQLVYPGHVTQIMWMFLYDALRTDDRELFQTAFEQFKRHAIVSRDYLYGGMFRCLRNAERNEWLLDKFLWVQEEPLIGALCILEHTGDRWAREFFGDLYTYTRSNFSLEEYGHSLWMLHTGRKATYSPHSERVDNFHHPRHLMYNLLALKRMRARDAKVSEQMLPLQRM